MYSFFDAEAVPDPAPPDPRPPRPDDAAAAIDPPCTLPVPSYSDAMPTHECNQLLVDQASGTSWHKHRHSHTDMYTEKEMDIHMHTLVLASAMVRV